MLVSFRPGTPDAVIPAGFQFLQRQSDQDIVDIGAIGLAYAVRRATGNK